MSTATTATTATATATAASGSLLLPPPPVGDTQWRILERFSRVTVLTQHAASYLLSAAADAHSPLSPIAVPLAAMLPAALRPSLPVPPPAARDGIVEYEPARVYLARWNHELQVQRSKEFFASKPPPPSPRLISSPETSYSIVDDAETAIVATDTLAKSARLAMLKQEFDPSLDPAAPAAGDAAPPAPTAQNLSQIPHRVFGVWDETVLADTGIGSFVVLSTDTTPPPPKVSRLPPLSLAEWKLYFNEYIPVPGAAESSQDNLEESMYFVPQTDFPDENTKPGDGRIVADFAEIQRRIFVGGVEPSSRSQVWRFLFGLYPWDSDAVQRKAIWHEKSTEYFRMKNEWKAIAKVVEQTAFNNINEPLSQETEKAIEMYKDAVTRVDKDVPRTDSKNPFYNDSISAQDSAFSSSFSPHQMSLRDILITYACSYPNSDGIGYVQGMSDLCSPFLIVCDGDESDAFWLFAQFMQSKKQNFLHTGTGMRSHLSTLGHLLRLTDPTLYSHLARIDALNMFFCFRWFLCSFKREFSLPDTCTLWEVLQTKMWGEEFEYFFALAIIDEHRDCILRWLWTFDEVLKYMNDLSHEIPVGSILEAAELLYLRFRVRTASLGVLPVVNQTRGGASETSTIPLATVLEMVEERERLARMENGKSKSKSKSD
ncbi:GTPase activating protein [Entophlyctis sp. JEL0112]|nr:GTPase activating protein [Entophlyctis sp. JEL0112]